MPTRGLVCVHYQGQDFVTYDHTEGHPRQIGARLARFALTCLQEEEEANRCAGPKVTPLARAKRARSAHASRLHGEALLAAIAHGETAQAVAGDAFSLDCRDCQYALLLDLDEGVVEFWDLSDRIESFPLASLGFSPLDRLA